MTRDRGDDRSIVGAEDDPHAPRDDQAHRVRPQQLDQVLSSIHAPEDEDFDDSPDGTGDGHGHQQPAPEPEAGAELIGDDHGHERGDHVDGAVRHVDDAQGPENQGQTRRHDEQVGGIRQPAHREQ